MAGELGLAARVRVRARPRGRLVPQRRDPPPAARRVARAAALALPRAAGRRSRAWDNVPLLSWLWLRGRCRRCGAPISLALPGGRAARPASLFAALVAAPRPRASMTPLWMAFAAALLAAAGDRLRAPHHPRRDLARRARRSGSWRARGSRGSAGDAYGRGAGAAALGARARRRRALARRLRARAALGGARPQLRALARRRRGAAAARAASTTGPGSPASASAT